MRHIVAMMLALSVPAALAAQGGGAAGAAGITVAAPNTEHMPVLMALVRHLDSALTPGAALMEGEEILKGFQERSPRVLTPEIMPVAANGVLITKGPTTTKRDSAETAALAKAIDGIVATPADTIWCNNGCHGTTGVQIRINQPSIVGDSAMVAYSLLARSNIGPGLPGRYNRVFVVMKKVDGNWLVTWNKLANQDRLFPLPDRKSGGR